MPETPCGPPSQGGQREPDPRPGPGEGQFAVRDWHIVARRRAVSGRGSSNQAFCSGILVWSGRSVSPSRKRRLEQCGGKRSATPLWIGTARQERPTRSPLAVGSQNAVAAWGRCPALCRAHSRKFNCQPNQTCVFIAAQRWMNHVCPVFQRAIMPRSACVQSCS